MQRISVQRRCPHVPNRLRCRWGVRSGTAVPKQPLPRTGANGCDMHHVRHVPERLLRGRLVLRHWLYRRLRALQLVERCRHLYKRAPRDRTANGRRLWPLCMLWDLDLPDDLRGA